MIRGAHGGHAEQLVGDVPSEKVPAAQLLQMLALELELVPG